MDSESERRHRPPYLRIVAGLLITAIVLEWLKRHTDRDDSTFSYIARNQRIGDAVGEEGLQVADLLTMGGCISRNVPGEFTGHLTEEEAQCITYGTKKACNKPCLWVSEDTLGGDEDLADIDDDAPPVLRCGRDADKGVCAPGYELDEHGCCNLPASELPHVGDVVFDLGADIAKGEVCGLIIALSPAIFKFLAGEGLTKGAEVAMKRAFKAMNMVKTGGRAIAMMNARLTTKMGVKFGAARVTSIGGKVATKLGARAAKQAAKATANMAKTMAKKMAATMAARAGAKMASMIAKASSVIAAPLIVFDIFSMMLDMGDPRGYNTFAENGVIKQAREVSEYAD